MTLRLEDFRVALAQNPTAARFIIIRDENGNPTLQASEEDSTRGESGTENMIATEILRTALDLEAPTVDVAELLPVNPLISLSSYPSLSAEKLQSVFERIDTPSNQSRSILSLFNERFQWIKLTPQKKEKVLQELEKKAEQQSVFLEQESKLAAERGDRKAAELHAEIAKALGGSEENPGAAFALNQATKEEHKGNTEVAEAWRACASSYFTQVEAYSQGNLVAAELLKQVSQTLGRTKEALGVATALKRAAEKEKKGDSEAVVEWNQKAQEYKAKAAALEKEIEALATAPKNYNEYRTIAIEAFKKTFSIFEESVGMIPQLVTDLAGRKQSRAKAEEALIAYDKPLIEFPRILVMADKSVREDTPHQKAWFDEQLEKTKQIKKELHSRLLDLLDFNTGPHQAVFWNGYVDGVQTLAIEFAKESGKQTLELTPGGHFLDSLNLYGRKSQISVHLANDLFDIASERFAQGANGEIHAFQAHYEPPSNSVFKRIEEPVLKSRSQEVVLKEENIHKKPKYSYWRTKGAAYESEEYRELYNALEEAQHNQSGKVLWRELHLLRHEASEAFNTAFVSMNEAVKTPEVQAAIGLFERAIEEAEKTQDLWSKTTAAFTQAKEEVPETLKAAMPKLLSYFERQAASWMAEIKWRQLRHQATLGDLHEEHMAQLLMETDSTPLTTGIQEEEATMIRCEHAAEEWKSFEEKLGAVATDSDKEKEYNKIKTTVAANRSKLIVAEKATEVIDLFHQLKRGLKGFSKEEIVKKRKQFKEAFESYGSAMKDYQQFLKRVEEAAPEDWSYSRGWQLIAEEWTKNKKAVEEARSNVIIKTASINDIQIGKDDAPESLQRAKSTRMGIGGHDMNKEDDALAEEAEDKAESQTPKITVDEFWEDFQKDHQALVKQFSPEVSKLILDMAAGKKVE